MHTLAGVFAFVWFLIIFFDTLFKSCLLPPYLKALQTFGLDIKPLCIYWRITRYNRLINLIGCWKPWLLSKWFNVGACIVCILIVPCFMLYIVSLFQMYNSKTAEDFDGSVLLPIIPGYNFPLAHWGYYIGILLLCSVVHELGHAIAASRERIGIDDLGFAVCAIFPLAFVHLRRDQFSQLSIPQQMRILCAGIWHNIILSLLAFIVWSIIFILLSPFFSTGAGITVLGVHQQSGLNNPAGFVVGDHITGISNCKVTNQESWRNCLKELTEKPQLGFCIPRTSKLQSIKILEHDRCSSSAGSLIFTTREVPLNGICLNARQVYEKSKVCSRAQDCGSSRFCAFPLLPALEKFIAIERIQKQPVLYAGSLNELASDIKMSDLVGKYENLPVHFAEAFVTLLEYIIMFSCGLAIVNMLPILHLDGQYIVENCIHIAFHQSIPDHSRRIKIFKFCQLLTIVVITCLGCVTAYKFYNIF